MLWKVYTISCMAYMIEDNCFHYKQQIQQNELIQNLSRKKVRKLKAVLCILF